MRLKFYSGPMHHSATVDRNENKYFFGEGLVLTEFLSQLNTQKLIYVQGRLYYDLNTFKAHLKIQGPKLLS